MIVMKESRQVSLHATRVDTERWAEKWPCSTLRGKTVRATFDSSGLVDMGVTPGIADKIDGHEFSAFCASVLKAHLEEDHPAWFVAVGQFE